MANSNKRKGDRAEREAVAAICRLAPDLVVARPQRLFGAGRREDTGDLWVLPGVTVQVKHRADPAQAIRLAADGAATQAQRAESTFAVGLVPIPRAPSGAVRWVSCCTAWPGRLSEGLVAFRSVTAALQHVRRDDGDTPPRAHRVAVVERSPTAALFLGPLEAWVRAYRGVVLGHPMADPAPRLRAIEATPPRTR